MRPIGVVLSIEDGARLSILGEPDVRLSKGDCLVFDGLCVHAGSAYPDAENYRVHIYLDTREKSGVRVPHETYLVDDRDEESALRYNNEYDYSDLRVTPPLAEDVIGLAGPNVLDNAFAEDTSRKRHKAMLNEQSGNP